MPILPASPEGLVLAHRTYSTTTPYNGTRAYRSGDESPASIFGLYNNSLVSKLHIWHSQESFQFNLALLPLTSHLPGTILVSGFSFSFINLVGPPFTTAQTPQSLVCHFPSRVDRRKFRSKTRPKSHNSPLGTTKPNQVQERFPSTLEHHSIIQ